MQHTPRPNQPQHSFAYSTAHLEIKNAVFITAISCIDLGENVTFASLMPGDSKRTDHQRDDGSVSAHQTRLGYNGKPSNID